MPVRPFLLGFTLLTLACEASQAGTSDRPVENGRPVADAGEDRQVSVRQVVALDGRGSQDPDGDRLTFAWELRSQPAGSFAALEGPADPRPYFIADREGVYVVSLVVSDGRAESDLALVVITAEASGTASDPPVAVISGPETAAIGARVTFDGASSFDLDGGALEYRWSLSAPSSSGATLDDDSGVAVSFVADGPGPFRLTLIVVDDEGLASQPAVHSLSAADELLADAGPDQEVEVGATVSLDGSRSVPADPAAYVSYQWRFGSKPADSGASLSSWNSVQTTFVADRPGTYVVELVVSQGYRDQDEDTVTITARLPPSDGVARRLGYEVIDAEYSRTLDRLVAISSSPSLLHVIEPRTGAETTVALPLGPGTVSVSPDGRRAAVAYDGFVSEVDLETPALLATHSVPAPGGDVVYAANGFAYVFPRTGQWTDIEGVELATGRLVTGTGRSIYGGTQGKLRPDGRVMYGADRGLSPADLERYSIAADGTPELVYDSPYHGDYGIGGDLWLSEDGRRIFTRAGTVFRTSDVQAEDMTYAGRLEGVTPLHVDHHAATGRIAAAPAGLGYQAVRYAVVELFDDEYLAHVERKALPPVVLGDREHELFGRMTFFSSAGDALFVLAEPAPASGLLEDVVVTFDLSGDD